MHLLLFIFGIVLLPGAYTLRCYECIPGTSGTCTETITECPQSSQCGVARVVTYAGGSEKADFSMKSCGSDKECISGSVSFGVSKTVFTSRCCTTDLCNNQTAPDPSPSVPNGKKCYTCNGQTCSASLNCEGDEDHCISATVTSGGEKTTVKGCASTQVCSNLRSAKVTAVIGQNSSCCQGDYCNSASSTSAGLLLLVAPLIKFIIFS